MVQLVRIRILVLWRTYRSVAGINWGKTSRNQPRNCSWLFTNEAATRSWRQSNVSIGYECNTLRLKLCYVKILNTTYPLHVFRKFAWSSFSECCVICLQIAQVINKSVNPSSEALQKQINTFNRMLNTNIDAVTNARDHDTDSQYYLNFTDNHCLLCSVTFFFKAGKALNCHVWRKIVLATGGSPITRSHRCDYHLRNVKLESSKICGFWNSKFYPQCVSSTVSSLTKCPHKEQLNLVQFMRMLKLIQKPEFKNP